MAIGLVITKPFGEYKRGDRVIEQDMVAKLLASHNASKVVRINVPDDSRFKTKAEQN